jgi:hypothetical protein
VNGEWTIPSQQKRAATIPDPTNTAQRPVESSDTNARPRTLRNGQPSPEFKKDQNTQLDLKTKTPETARQSLPYLATLMSHETQLGDLSEPMFERVTDRSRKVLTLAHEQAAAFAHSSIHTGHVVLGLATEGDGVAANVLRYSQVDLKALSDRIAVQSFDPENANDEMVALDSAAMHTARMLNHNYCGTEHLLFGICILPSLCGASALTDVGASLSHVGEEILNLLGHFELSYKSVFEAYKS